MNRPVVVHLSTVHHAGDNRIANKEVPALREAGIPVTLVIRAQDGTEASFPLVALPPAPGRLARLTVMQARAWRELARLRPRVLHVHDPELIPLAWLWARAHRTRWIYDAHEDLIEQVASKRYLPLPLRPVAHAYARLLTRIADRGADAVVAATPPVGARYANPSTVVVHNYPWLREYTRTPEPVPGRLVYVGDLSDERKLSFMVEVVHRVRRRVPAAHLVLAGRLLPEADAVAGTFDGDVVTHLGLLSPGEIPALLASAQVGLIFLAPFRNYQASLPTKLFEYMAAGVPFAASDFPFWRASFAGYDAGVFCDSEDAAATAETLAALLDDPARCARLGRNGRAAVEAHHTFEREAEKLVGLTERLGARR